MRRPSLFPSIHHHPLSSLTHFVRSRRFMSCPARSLILCHRFIQPKQKKKKFIFKKKFVKKKHGGCPWMFQLWRLCVVFLCCYCRRVAVCADACTYSPLPPSFSRPWCGADGDRDFFFYKLLYIDRAQSKLLSKNHVVCIVFVSKKQSDIRLRTAQRREHQLGKDYPSCFGSDDLIA